MSNKLFIFPLHKWTKNFEYGIIKNNRYCQRSYLNLSAFADKQAFIRSRLFCIATCNSPFAAAKQNN